jgi:hypothetical protein
MPVTYIRSALRRQVHKRAQNRCEYCLIPESFAYAPHEIDHIIALKHGGSSDSNNLALSCILCNKLKGSDIASVDQITDSIVPLFNPRLDKWQEHFQLRESQIIGLTPVGRATVRLLQLNSPDRITERELLILEGVVILPE